MRSFYWFIFLLLSAPVFGQHGVDTLGLTGTIGDTVVANRLLGEMKGFIKERKWPEAEEKGEKAMEIYVRLLGENSKPVADLLHQEGFIGYGQGNYNEAVQAWEKSLNIRLKVLGPEHLDVAKSYNNLGSAFEAKGEYEKAVEYHQKALEIKLKALGPEHPNVAISYLNLGNCSNLKGEYDKAIEYYQKALDINLLTLGPEHPNVAGSYNNLGGCYEKKGEYDKAIKYKQKALDIRLKIFKPDDPNVADSYMNLGNSYSLKGEYDKALEYYQKDLDISLKTLGPEHPNVAGSYNSLGVSYEEKGEYDKAIEQKQKALDIRLKILGPEHPDVADSYNNLGNSYDSKGEFDKAIDYHIKALNIRLKIFGTQHLAVSDSYNNLGVSYRSKGEFDKSIEQGQKALDIRLKILGPEHLDVAHSYNGLGNSYEHKGEYDKAIEYHRKSLEIKLKTLGPEHPDVADSYNGLGNSYESKGEYDKALEYYQKDLDISLKTLGPKHPDVAISYNNIAAIFCSKRQYKKVIENYHKTLVSCDYFNGNFSKVNSFKQLLNGLNGLSLAFQEQYFQIHDSNLVNTSYDYSLQAMAALNYQQTTFTEESTKSYWQNKNYSIYELAINIALLKAQVENNAPLRQTTFTYAEKSKAALLQAQLKATDAINFAGIADSLLQKEHDLRIDITWREKQRQALLDKGIAETDTNALRISSIIFDLKRDYEALKQRFERENPEYYRLKYDLNTVSLRYVQDTLLQPKKQALLEYFVGDSSIYLFVVRPDTLLVREVPRDFPLEDWIEQFRQGLYGYYTADKSKQTNALYEQSLNQYLEYAPKLYQKLVAPVQELLPEQGSVVIVPDGPLGYIPFDALLTAAPENPNDFKQYPYLMNRYQFSYTYSATLLQEMRDKKHHHEPSKPFVAFAPFYNGDTTLLAGMYTYDELMRKDLQPLAYSGPEVAAASKLMHGEIVSGQAATEARFTSTAGNYRILHLATHGRADNRVGDYAFLAFTEIKDSLENELLYVKDLYNLELNADLVVLSACETGIGKLQRGEGIISLARAFAYAGAKSMVTTLWEVNDKSTSELMRYFYRALQNGENKDQALRSARREYFAKTNGRGGHPFFWAAFIPIGDMRPVKK